MAQIGIYDIGDIVRVAVNIQVASADADPTTLALTISPPSGADVTKAIADLVKSSVGDYYYDYTPTLAGMHHVRWAAGGTAVGVEESAFYVRTSAI